MRKDEGGGNKIRRCSIGERKKDPKVFFSLTKLTSHDKTTFF